jgi:hypothetical protein
MKVRGHSQLPYNLVEPVPEVFAVAIRSLPYMRVLLPRWRLLEPTRSSLLPSFKIWHTLTATVVLIPTSAYEGSPDEAGEVRSPRIQLAWLFGITSNHSGARDILINLRVSLALMCVVKLSVIPAQA